ncbi:MAG TPA: hypothetical protein VHU80_11265 [Polyangiaceae bacterium]|jgi:DNA-directed RNA polymerase subunit RPC12/RpoP|nr:hypothetical protein [Polyangiaceae bacterium]
MTSSVRDEEGKAAPLRIYADFNGLVEGCRDPHRTAVVLDTIGSLRELSNAGVVLRPGLPLICFDESDDNEDLEGWGTAEYDRVNKRWVVEFDARGVQAVPTGDRSSSRLFLCVKCRRDLQPLFDAHSLSSTGACPHCGTAVLAPYAPPP